MDYAQSYFCSSHSLSFIAMSVTDKKNVPEVEEEELVLEHPNNICNWSDDIKQWPSIVYGDIYTYLIDSKTVDGTGVKSWKSFYSLNYWLSGWVVSCNIEILYKSVAYENYWDTY